MLFASNRHRRRRAGEGGISSVEFAVVAFMFMLLMMGIFDFARYLYTVQALETLTSRLGRMYLLPQPGSDEGRPAYRGLTSAELAAVAPPLLDPSLVSVSWPAANWGRGVTSGTVTVRYTYTALFLVVLNGTLTQSATFDY